jgi:type I restriction-modification system DNA methylase subunit
VGRGPEESVRQALLSQLRDFGWREEQIQWKPEWHVPDTPHDLTKRERGQKFGVCGSCDIVLFDDDSREWHALRVVFELKAPHIDAGRAQLIRYLSNEPMAKMGFWSNGSARLAIYKTPDGKWIEVEGALPPRPDEDLTRPPQAPLTWDTMVQPTEPELVGAFKRLLDVVVARDTRSTRRESQLRELTHVLLVKLESDSTALMDGTQTPVSFRVVGSESDAVERTAERIRQDFRDLFARRRDTIFSRDDTDDIRLDDDTIYQTVVELSRYRLLFVGAEVIATAFQVLRTKALKSGEGQFLTPQRIIKPCVMALDIQINDKIIDPACGTGGFLFEAMRQVGERLHRQHPGQPHLAAQLLTKWANERCYGVDVDDIGVKLTRTLMLALGDGSTHTFVGDSIASDRWREHYPHLLTPLADGQFTVAVTNPPFGQSLKVKGAAARKAGYTITAVAGGGKHVDLEIGLVFLERAWRLLRVGGRVGIVLPETYFFSHKYRWLPSWLEGRLALRGMINIPMEAFQEFCRAKTNFYILEKIGDGSAEQEET